VIPELERSNVLVRLGVAAGRTGAIGFSTDTPAARLWIVAAIGMAVGAGLDGVLAVRWKE
jgi:hypothetical protein